MCVYAIKWLDGYICTYRHRDFMIFKIFEQF